MGHSHISTTNQEARIRAGEAWNRGLLDDQTHFWIAQQVVDSKFMANITPLFREGRKIACETPTVVITDGAPNFNSAIRRAYWRENKALAIQHVRHVRMSGDRNNNRVERFNGEIRDREKVMRSMKKDDSPILTGYQIFHNYVRLHMALDGKDKWLTIIQSASKPKN
jgi:hypothetical protein